MTMTEKVLPPYTSFGMGGSNNANRSRELSTLIQAFESSLGSNGRIALGRDDGLNLLRLEAAVLMGMDTDMRRQRNLTRRLATGSRNSEGGGDTRRGSNNTDEGGDAGDTPSSLRFGRSSSSVLGGRPGSPRRVARGLPSRGVSTTHLETAELLMRGISEDEQLAMAIAMSLRDAQPAASAEQQQEGTATATEGAGQANNASNESSQNRQGRNGDESSSDSGSDTNTGENTGEAESLDDEEEEVVFVSA